MGLQQLEWMGLYTLSFILGFPYFVEFLRIYLLHLSANKASTNDFKDNSKSKTWLDHIVYSRRWYDFVQTRIWGAPPLWLYPFAWVIVASTYTASTWLTWSNPQNYNSFGYNFILALLFPHALLTLVWIPSFFRIRSHLWAMVSSLVIVALAITSFTVHGINNVSAGFYLYIPFLAWWIWIAWVSAEVWRDARQNKREDFAFDDVYEPQNDVGFQMGHETHSSGKHGWEIVQDPTFQTHRIPPSAQTNAVNQFPSSK